MIVLRDFNQHDIDLLVQYLNNKHVTKYLTSRIPQPYTIEDAKWWVNDGSKIGIVRAIEVNGNFVGTISATAGEHENQRAAELGYWLAEDRWGKGLATEAVAKMTNYVFSDTEVVRLFAPVFSPNKPSMRVLEKCGYKLEGILEKAIYKDGEFVDEHLYAKIHSITRRSSRFVAAMRLLSAQL